MKKSLRDMDFREREEVFSLAYENWTPWKCEGLAYLNEETGELVGQKRLSKNPVFLPHILLCLIPVNFLDTMDAEEFFTEEEIAAFGRCILTSDYEKIRVKDEAEFKRRILNALEFRFDDGEL